MCHVDGARKTQQRGTKLNEKLVFHNGRLPQRVLHPAARALHCPPGVQKLANPGAQDNKLEGNADAGEVAVGDARAMRLRHLQPCIGWCSAMAAAISAPTVPSFCSPQRPKATPTLARSPTVVSRSGAASTSCIVSFASCRLKPQGFPRPRKCKHRTMVGVELPPEYCNSVSSPMQAGQCGRDTKPQAPTRRSI